MRTMQTYLGNDGATYCGFEPRELSDRPIPERPSPGHAWSPVEDAWTLDLERLAAAVRAERNHKLRESDPLALPDYPHADETVRQTWQDYRQALRDLPGQEGFPLDVTWPEKPGE
ncbi:tail fiber assembly protein [Desulfocurvibacter africanus]|uniref:tail fiber assembly protein n=1 Tax=Desulfocurvibacter africanus TaxID=873 RepID=UPI00068593FB|nr:tail fiber assembly protein [Desulfocurvibacter africanus]